MTKNIQSFAELDSTNAYCLRQINELPDGAVIVADTQTQGRGRRGRQWLSPAGLNLYFSIVVAPPWGQADPCFFSLAAALAVSRAAQEQQVESWVKWPNDVWVDQKKLAGILAESTGNGPVVVGVGVNVNMSPEQLAQVDRPATSLFAQTGKKTARTDLLHRILAHWQELFQQMQESSFAALYPEWKAKDQLTGRTIRLLQEGREWQGTVLGLGPDGSLMLTLDNGGIQHFSAGEAHLIPGSDEA